MDYRKLLPPPPEECRDPDLFRLLNEFHFVRWHPDYETRRDEIRRELSSDSILLRAEQALDDPADELRRYAGELLIWVRREDAAPTILKLLSDPSDVVREGIAEVLSLIRCDSCVDRLIELATSDRSPSVRGCAASGLGAQDPLRAIPTLIGILDNDHEAAENGQTPCHRAATALDEMMKTEWTQKRHAGNLRSLPPDGIDLASLREQALLYLQRYQRGQNRGE